MEEEERDTEIPIEIRETFMYLLVPELLLLLQREHPFFTTLPKHIQEGTIEQQYHFLQHVLTCFRSPRKCNLVIIGEDILENSSLVQQFLEFTTLNNINLDAHHWKLPFADGVELYLFQALDSDVIFQIFVFTAPMLKLNLEQRFMLSDAVYLLLFDFSKIDVHPFAANLLHIISSYVCTSFIYIIGTHCENLADLKANSSLIEVVVNDIQFLFHNFDKNITFVPPPSKLFEGFDLKNVWPLTHNPNQLLESVVSQLQSNLLGEIPPKWITFRTSLYHHRLSNTNGNIENIEYSSMKNLDFPHSAYMCGFLTQKDLITKFEEGDDKEHRKLINYLSSMGDILYYKNYLQSEESIIILKPKIIISMISKIKTLQSDLPPHIEYTSNLYQIPRDVITQLSPHQSKFIAKNFLLPVLKLREGFIPVSPKLYYFPDRIQPAISNISRNILKLQKQNSNIVNLERRYEFKYIPQVCISRVIAEIWRQLKYYPEFHRNLLYENLFWEYGIILTNTLSFKNIDFTHDAICILQWDPRSLYQKSVITIKLSEPANKSVEKYLIPILHRSILFGIINALEFHRFVRIFCSASSVEHKGNTFYDYDACFQTLKNDLPPHNQNAYPPPTILPLLIPEYYEQIEDTFHSKINIVKKIDERISGELFLGYCDTLREQISIKRSLEINDTINELSILRSLNHSKIIRILDVSNDPPPISFITRYYNDGDLINYLQTKNYNIRPIDACSIIRDICNAISYLHNQSPAILHTNLREVNIFINETQFRRGQVFAVISGFDYSRFADPITGTSGSKSKNDDVARILLIVHRVLDCVKDSSDEEFREATITALEEILRRSNEENNFCVSLEHISDLLSKNIIGPYHEKMNILQEPSYTVVENISITNLVKEFLFRPCDMNELLQRCMNDLHSSKDDDEWEMICRQVIPILGCAIEENLFNIEHLNRLRELNFNFHPDGDFVHSMTILHFASKCANYTLLESIFENNLYSPETVNNLTNLPSKSAAIHLALSSEKHPSNLKGLDGTLCVINILITHGADINLQDGKGETALIKAGYAGSVHLITYLLDYKLIDVNISSNENITAIIAASRGYSENHQQCVKLLLLAGSAYSSYLQIGKSELARILQVVTGIIDEKLTLQNRILRSIQSWDQENNLSKDILEARRISILMKKLKMENNHLPLHFSIKEVRKYLQNISLLSKKLNVNISNDIPLHVQQNALILEHLQVLELLQVLEISFDQIPAVFKQDTNGQLQYLKELKNGKQSTQKLNLMVVGEEGVGKTNLVRKLVSDSKWAGSTFNVKIRKGITDGIDIHVLKPDGRDFVLNIYDFAGQEIYYSTHQLVLSSKAIYLLLFNASVNINFNRIAHWIHTLSDAAPSASIFIIGTHFDKPEALEILPQNLKDIRSILNNILQLNRKRSCLEIIPPSRFQFPIPELIASKLSTIPKDLISECDNFPIWPISLSNEGPNDLTPLFDVILTYLKLPSVVVPASWLTFRSFLLPQVSNDGDDDLSLEIEKIKLRETLHSQPAFKVGILYYNEIVKYGKELIGLEDPSQFIDLLESWGDIIYVRNPRDISNSLIIIKPTILIELCKTFITAKNILDIETSMRKKTFMKLKKIFHIHDTPHLLKTTALESKLMKLLTVSDVQAKLLVRDLVIPALIGLQLIYPFNVIDVYLVPAMLRKPKPTLDIINFNRHPFHPKYRTKQSNQIIIMERQYNFVYLPSGLFTRLMLQIWEYFSNFQEYSGNLLNEQLFWEDGFIISDSINPTTNKFNYYQNDIGIITCNNNEGTARSIDVRISCPKSKAANILPFIHKTINTFIQFLEFSTKTKILCCAADVNLKSQFYEYDDCFPSSENQSENLPPKELLPYLVPEYYLAKFDSPSNSITHNYNDEVKVVKKIGQGQTADVYLGYWHSKRVAVKKLRSEIPPSEVSTLLHEISLLKSVHHRNVLGHLDVYQDPIVIVMEYCEGGDLENTLSRSEDIHPMVFCCILRDICQGISYLHNMDPPILHCDIRQGNIFIKSLDLNASTLAVLGDIGYARIADRNRVAGDKSWKDDLDGIIDTIKALLDTRFLSINSEENESNNLKLRVIEVMNSILQELQNVSSNVYYDPIQIANFLTSQIITPFFDNNNNFKYNEFAIIEERILNQHPVYEKFKVLHQRFTNCHHDDNNNNIIIISENNDEQISSILGECMDLLKSEKLSIPSQDYWHCLCRYLIPIIGHAAEMQELHNGIISELGQLDFYNHPLGDFEHHMMVFQYACLSANLFVVERFIPLSIDHITTFGGVSQSALHLVVNSISHPKNKDGVDRTLQVIDILIKNGADINFQDGNGETALIKAAKTGSLPLVVHLLNFRGIDVNISSNEKITAIIAASKGNDSEEYRNCIKVLLQFGSECSSYLSIRQIELQRIKKVADDLIDEKHSIYGRCSHTTVTIQSWRKFEIK